MKLFVNYEIAAKLKKLGFDEECLARFDSDNDLIHFAQPKYCESQKKCAYIYGNNSILAPTWEQAIDWFESKGLYINTTRIHEYSVSPPKFEGWCVYIGLEDPEINLEYNKYFLKNFFPTKSEARKIAILKAIEYLETISKLNS